MQTSKSITQIITILAALVVFLIVIIFPLGYFLISYRYMVGHVETRADFHAFNITKAINANHEMWEFSKERLEGFLRHDLLEKHPKTVHILNAKNEIVAEVIGKLNPPVIMRTSELMDSGVVVGRIELYHSIQPILIETGLIALLMIPIGLGAFIILRILPIKAIYRAEEALKSALQESQLRQKEISALLESSRVIMEYHEFKDAAQLIFGSCKNLIGADAGYVAMLSKDGTRNELLFLDAGGRSCSVDPLLPMPIRGLRGEVHRSGKTIYHNNFSDSKWGGFMPQGHVKLDNVLFAPLITNGKVSGLLGLANKPGGFTEQDARMASAFGELAAIALLNSRTLELLKEATNKAQKYLDIAGVMIVVIGANQKVSLINKKGCQVLGYEENEIIGKNWFDIFIPIRMRQDVKSTFTKLIAGDIKPVEYFENPVLTKSGEERIIAWHNTILRDENGNIIGTLSSGEDITERQSMTGQIVRQSAELGERNLELSALYKVSSAINRTIDISDLFSTILNTVTELEILKIERKGGIFIVEGDRMILVSHLGHPESFLNMHKNITVNDCLCGLAARTGEIVISKNSFEDDRHSIRYPDMSPHGHIIIPLKARDRVVGVLYLYLPPDTDIDESEISLLYSIGNQIGIAIDNSKLYEETKALSLRDPLTGLANRRLMHIIFEKNLAEAKRFKKPFSVIMLDIDNFKIYNDTKGHVAGDKLLSDLANLISSGTRKVDLAVRYGGEEFLLLLQETDTKGAYTAAEKIRKIVEADLGVTISLGISTYHNETKEELINKADNALYQAKQKGRNRVEVSN